MVGRSDDGVQKAGAAAQPPDGFAGAAREIESQPHDVAVIDHALVVRPLHELSRRREAMGRIGVKARLALKLLKAGLAVPPSWVIESSWHRDWLDRFLPRKHDLPTLIKLAGTAAGDERCARAYEELAQAPLPEPLCAAVEAWWRIERQAAPQGFAVRPSPAAEDERAARHLHGAVAGTDAASLLAQIQRVFAHAVLSDSVAAYAEAALREAPLAILLQRAVPCDLSLLLAARGTVGLPTGSGPARRVLVAPLSGLDGGGPPELLALRAALGETGVARLSDMTAAVGAALGEEAVIAVAVERSEPCRSGPCRLHVLGAVPGPPAAQSEPAAGAFAQLRLGEGPPGRLGLSVAARALDGSLHAALRAVGCKGVGSMTRIAAGRAWVDLGAIVDAVRDAPAADPGAVLRAIGTGGAADEAAGERFDKHAIGELKRGARLVRRQIGVLGAASEAERRLQREARALAEMDVTLLPTDAIAVTLAGAADLLQRGCELWSQIAASELMHQLLLSALLRRRVPEVPALGAAVVMSGGLGSFGYSLAVALARVVEVFRGDDDAQRELSSARSPRDLPDGPGRGAFGQFLASYGDVCRGAFALERPRWREDAADPIAMVRLWLARADASRATVELAQQRVRALADAELARFEPELGALDRVAARAIIDRGRGLARARVGVVRLVMRLLALLRDVALDADRRLLRIDPSCRPGGAFDCSIERLCASFKSGRPELHRVLRMREVERAIEQREPELPAGFSGHAPPRCATVERSSTLAGIGLSPGVVDGRARIAAHGVPTRLEPGEILVVPALDVALCPIYALCAGVAAESGGALSPAAEALRELCVPAAASLPHAGAVLRDGDRLRLDGERGTIQIFDR